MRKGEGADTEPAEGMDDRLAQNEKRGPSHTAGAARKATLKTGTTWPSLRAEQAAWSLTRGLRAKCAHVRRNLRAACAQIQRDLHATCAQMKRNMRAACAHHQTLYHPSMRALRLNRARSLALAWQAHLCAQSARRLGPETCATTTAIHRPRRVTSHASLVWGLTQQQQAWLNRPSLPAPRSYQPAVEPASRCPCRRDPKYKWGNTTSPLTPFSGLPHQASCQRSQTFP